jgi:gamma-glutamyltranspeptidase / glutathione hydrolase
MTIAPAAIASTAGPRLPMAERTVIAAILADGARRAQTGVGSEAMTVSVPCASVRALRAVAVSADQLATQAAMSMFTLGGNAVDAALAANAVLAVTAPHLCGMGGDLFALVRTPAGEIVGLNASGRAGSGADPAALRAERLTSMPLRHDIRSVTVPGCVDGWIALHRRFASLDLTKLLGPAIRLAAAGFPASPLLVGSLGLLDDPGRAQLHELADQATKTGSRVRRPGVALTLHAIVAGGRAGFYGGAFGEGLLMLGDGLFTSADLETVQAEWVEPLQASAFGVDLATIGPNSQGYLTLGTARLAETYGVPDDPDDADWAHVLIEATTAASHDRPAVLHEGADGASLLADIDDRLGMIDAKRAGERSAPAGAGDTTYLCTADHSGMAVSLIQSNAAGFGSWLVEPTTGINLHNRGLGFSLEEGHAAELGPGRRPPHTLCPAIATTGPDRDLAAVFGTMGGDAQPQILLQLAVRMFHHDASPAEAVSTGRWALRGPATGFDTWTSGVPPTVMIEGHAPTGWRTGLLDRGHPVDVAPPFDSGFGHAHVIRIDRAGTFAAAADPRARIGSAAGI